MKVLLSATLIASTLFSHICFDTALAHETQVPPEEPEMMEMVMTPVIPMSSLECLGCVGIKGAGHAEIPCTDGHCLRDGSSQIVNGITLKNLDTNVPPHNSQPLFTATALLVSSTASTAPFVPVSYTKTIVLRF